ncbi:reticulon 21 [Hibiscus trionum]|uniref:Reticulon-like protein n=1 Tax=Hibiscus trionum TaxID=183268 RepID=A0A9W7HWR5_HIBTR|nr:reticulon 21 [Hibiscus trionum]
MALSCRRQGGVKSGVVVAGSVLETRMKSDGFKGGIMVSNGEEDTTNGGKRLSLKKGQTVGGGKRKTWKNESFDGFEKKTPIRVCNGRSSTEHCKDLSLFVDNGVKKTPFQVRKGAGRSPVHMKKQRSEVLIRTGKGNGNGNEGSSVQLRRSKSEGNEDLGLDSIAENEKNPVETDKNSEEFNVCQEKIISSCGNNGDTAKVEDDDDDDVEDDDEFCEEQTEEEDEETEAGNEKKKSFDIKEMNVQDEKLAKVVNGVKKLSQFHDKTATFSSKSESFAASDEYHYQTFPQTQNKLQNIVDLVMWRDVSKSALIFGIGTFITISSSYTQDLNISFISVISYVGLVYLAAIFLHRSIICRGVMEINEPSYVVGKEEAIWLLELFLPYLNEFLLKLKALFSGDPATTMKLAVLLFVLARCGSSITIWKMAKLGFFGVFIVPKLCSSYSNQLTAYGKFWIRRFRDAWDSCTHKKAVAMAIFTLVWNLCSTVARIWAAFVLFVALRYYQQKMTTTTEYWVEEEEEDAPASEETRERSMGEQRHGLRTSEVEPVKVKKGS